MEVRGSKLKFYILLLFIILVVISSIIFHANGYHMNILRYLKSLQYSPNLPWIYISLYFISSFFPLPFITFLGAAIFPFHEVFILSLIGNTISFVIMFYLTRWLGRDYIELYEHKHSRLNDIDFKVSENAFLYVFLLRLFFIVPPEAVNILSGLSKMRFREYFTASFLGTIPIVIFSILLVESYKMKNIHLLLISASIIVICIFIPLIFIKELKAYFKRK